MDSKLAEHITAIATDELRRAESIWDNVSGDLLAAKAAYSEQASRLPGHEVVHPHQPSVDDYIAVFVDLRDSSDHLRHYRKVGQIQTLQRVFYETAVLLPTCAEIAEYHRGRTVEYLGDGALSFFRADLVNRDQSVDSVFCAARDCLTACDSIINPLLTDHGIPGIVIGVGMAYSRAIITTVGSPAFSQPKAIGECVFYAAKLCKGRNEIHIDKALKCIWPIRKGGTVRFKRLDRSDGIEGYCLSYD